VTVSATGRADPGTAWERYAVLDNWPRWAPQITGVDASSERLQPGTTGRVHGPLGVSAGFVVDAVDEQARTWSWTVRRWPLTLRLTHAVRQHEKGSSTSLTIEGPLPVVTLYAPLARFALGRLVA
jgi:hypothetical protein